MKLNKSLLGTVVKCILIIGACFLVSHYWYQIFLVSGESMEPTYHNMQFGLLDRHTPKEEYVAGDVIIFHCEEYKRALVKRIVAVPGDTVLFKDGRLYVNGQDKTGNWGDCCILPGEMPDYEVVVPETAFFVMGDNQAHSIDSRYDTVGFVPFDKVKGIVCIVFG